MHTQNNDDHRYNIRVELKKYFPFQSSNAQNENNN